MRPVVNTEKHYQQSSLGSVASGAITNIEVLNAVAVPTATNEVRQGSIVSAIYVEMWITTDDANQGSSIVTLEKVPGAVTTFMTAADSATLGNYDNKKNIFFTQMGLTPGQNQFPMATIKGWFKIPKGKQRMGLDDKIHLNLHGQSNGLAFCGFTTYKEQF